MNLLFLLFPIQNEEEDKTLTGALLTYKGLTENGFSLLPNHQWLIDLQLGEGTPEFLSTPQT